MERRAQNPLNEQTLFILINPTFVEVFCFLYAMQQLGM
jgi:hypothetical protein